MTARTKADYEQFLLNEIRELPEHELEKILKLIHFVKEEIFQTENAKKEDLKIFLESFGSWQDEKAPEEIIHEIYESRKSTIRDIQL